MNKFVAIILLACVAGAAAWPQRMPDFARSFIDFEHKDDAPARKTRQVDLIDLNDPMTEMSLNPTNEEETNDLKGDATMFADFCIKSRDYVIGDIKHSTNGIASTIFAMFFKNAEEIGQNALNVEADALAKLGNQIANPDAAIAAAAEGDASAQIIADGQQKIQAAQTQPRTFLQAVISTISATSSSVSSEVVSRLEGLKNAVGVPRVLQAVSGICNKITQYQEQNKASFADFAKAIAAKDAALGATPFENVACLTARRIARLDGICKFSAVAQGPVAQIIKSVA